MTRSCRAPLACVTEGLFALLSIRALHLIARRSAPRRSLIFNRALPPCPCHHRPDIFARYCLCIYSRRPLADGASALYLVLHSCTAWGPGPTAVQTRSFLVYIDQRSAGTHYDRMETGAPMHRAGALPAAEDLGRFQPSWWASGTREFPHAARLQCVPSRYQPEIFSFVRSAGRGRLKPPCNVYMERSRCDASLAE